MILFKRYALQMQKKCAKVLDAQIFQAEDAKRRAWLSYVRKKLFEVLAHKLESLTYLGNFMAKSHVDIILLYYYKGWDKELPKDGQETLRAWHWHNPQLEFKTMQNHTARL